VERPELDELPHALLFFCHREVPFAGGTRMMSGFGDGAAEGLERDVIRFGSPAHAGVECVQRFEIGGSEFEVEHAEVLGDPSAGIWTPLFRVRFMVMCLPARFTGAVAPGGSGDDEDLD
jgi:hypothetical protein